MQIITSPDEMQKLTGELRSSGKRIGFVPTMGYLHDGHLSLVRYAREKTDVVVMSIFVNPTQFGPAEDFEQYPRDRERDTRLASEAGVDFLFMPEKENMYPKGFGTYVMVEELSTKWEGKIRPTHFRGVTTIVLLLFNIVQPHVAVFGQKDIQQAIILRKMVKDLMLNVEIIIAPIIRETDGLAMSSRNVYLSKDERSQAPSLHRSLREAEAMIVAGERNAKKILEHARGILASAQLGVVDYLTIMEMDRLDEVQQLESGNSYVLALAVRFGSTRLIDNCIVHVS